MGEQALQSITNAVHNLMWGIASVLLGPTIFLLLLKMFVPIVGNPLWRAYCQLLAWLFVAPIRLVRLMVREATSRRRR